jgi:hypothetical protein
MKILLALLAIPITANAWQFEAGAGATIYQTENGRWYQNGQPQNEVTKHAPAFSFGVAGSVLERGNWGLGWHGDYVNLGRASASCMCLARDEDYAAGREGPRARFSGSGRAQGVSLTLEPYYWTHGVRVGVEAGAFVYHSSWSESVTGWTVNDLPRQDIALSSSRWNVAPVAGVSVGSGPWSLSYRHYFMHRNIKGQSVPPLWNDANVIEIKRRF